MTQYVAGIGRNEEDGRVAARHRKGWGTASAATLLTVLSILPVAWAEARPSDDREVAAVFAPWTGREGAFLRAAAADGRVVREGVLDSILVVRGDRPGLIDRLYAAGAWIVIDPVAFGGCLVNSSSRRH
jgi:hypothetical protein